jgi:hypothetical protein
VCHNYSLSWGFILCKISTVTDASYKRNGSSSRALSGYRLSQNGIGPIDSKDLTREAEHNESVFIPLINKWSQLVNVLISVCIAKDYALLGIKTELVKDHIKYAVEGTVRCHYS